MIQRGPPARVGGAVQPAQSSELQPRVIPGFSWPAFPRVFSSGNFTDGGLSRFVSTSTVWARILKGAEEQKQPGKSKGGWRNRELDGGGGGGGREDSSPLSAAPRRDWEPFPTRHDAARRPLDCSANAEPGLRGSACRRILFLIAGWELIRSKRSPAGRKGWSRPGRVFWPPPRLLATTPGRQSPGIRLRGSAPPSRVAATALVRSGAGQGRPSCCCSFSSAFPLPAP